MDVLFWILGIVALAIIVTGLVLLGRRGLRFFMRRAGERRVAARYRAGEARRVDTAANFIGLGSRGTRQIRGSGVLVLAPAELWFGAYVLRRELYIPRAHIHAVGLVGSHLHKKILGRKLLHVRFAAGAGEDTAAWLVADPEGWKRDIEQWLGRGPAATGGYGGSGAQRT